MRTHSDYLFMACDNSSFVVSSFFFIINSQEYRDDNLYPARETKEKEIKGCEKTLLVAFAFTFAFAACTLALACKLMNNDEKGLLMEGGGLMNADGDSDSPCFCFLKSS